MIKIDIKIIAETERGKKALIQHLEESQKIGRLRRMTARKMGFRQEVISEEPFTVLLSITHNVFNKLLEPKDLIYKIKEALKENGADLDFDYKIEVV